MKIDNEQLDVLRRERDRYILQHKWRKALSVIEKMIAIQPSASCYTRCAMILTKLRNYDAAKKSLQQALDLNADYEKAKLLFAKLNEKSIRLEKAKTKSHSWDKEDVYKKWEKLQEVSPQQDTDKSFTMGMSLNSSPDADFTSEKTILYTQNQQNDDFTLGGGQSKSSGNSYPRIEHCAIDKKINSGGMGVIYRGIQTNLQREIALKGIQPQMAKHDHQKDKFISEAMVTAYLDHPNIIPVYEMGVGNDDELLLTMKLINGSSWHELLHPFTRSQREKADEYDLIAHLEILQNVCNAMAFAHNKGIVHNDLKPANIMVGEFGEVFVMDWGIAVDISEPPQENRRALHCKEVKFPMGTPSYMPPELARGKGKKIGPWTDVYLLGGILYEILMGKSPHKAKSLKESIHLSCNDMPAFDDNIPDEIREVCEKALQKDIGDRYQSINAFKKALQDFLQHRESVIITQQSQELLERCEKNIRESQLAKTPNIERNRVYDDFAKALAGFQQAMKLWGNNKDAARGQFAARFAYATAALQNRDLGLAEAQAREIEDPAKKQPLIQEIAIAKEKTLRSLRMAKVLRRSLIVAVLVIISTLTSGIWLINKSHNKTIQERERTESARRTAIARAQEIEKQKDINTTQRDRALVNLANIAMRRAQESLDDAQETGNSAHYAHCGVYAGLAFEYLHNVPGEQLLKDKSQELIRRALIHTPAIWQTPYIYKWTPTALAYSSDGKYLFSGAEDNTLRMWDVQTGKQLRIFDGHSQGVTAVLFIDDKHLISASRDKTIRIWDIQEKQATGVLEGHSAEVTGLAYENNRLVSTDKNKSIRIWNLQQKKLIRVFEQHEFAITTLATMGDAIAVNQQNDIYLWNMRSGKRRILKGHEKPITKLIRINEHTIASASQDHSIRIWNKDSDSVVLQGHKDIVNDIDYLSNHQQIVSLSADKTICFWDIQTQKLLRTLPTKTFSLIKVNPNGRTFVSVGKGTHQKIQLWSTSLKESITRSDYQIGSVEQVTFSPNGKIIATSSGHTICIWDRTSGEKMTTFTNEKRVRTLKFDPRGRYLISSSGQNLCLWDIKTGEKQQELSGKQGIILSVDCSRDGETIVACSITGHCGIWNLQNPKEYKKITAHSAAVIGVELLSKNVFATASYDKKIKVWDIHKEKPLRVLKGHTNLIYGLSYNRKRGILASAAIDRTIRIWNPKTGKEIKTLFIDKMASDIDFSPSGKNIAFGCYGYDNSIKVYDVDLGKKIHTFEGHQEEVHSVRYSEDGKMLASCSGDHTLRLWRVSDKKKFRLLEGHNNSIAHMSHFSNRIISVGVDQKIIHWNADTGKILQTFAQKELMISTSCSNDESMLAAISINGTVMIWDIASGKKIRHLRNKNWNFHSVIFSPDDKKLLLTTYNPAVIQVVEIKTGKVQKTLSKHKNRISHMTFNKDGTLLISADNSGLICLWQYTTGKILQTFSGHKNIVNRAVFSPDEKQIISVSDDETIRIWDVASGKQQHILRGHEGAVTSVVYLSQNVVASASVDKTIRLWNLHTQKTSRILRGHKDAVSGLAHIKATNTLASSSLDATVRLWDLQEEKLDKKSITSHNKNTVKFYDTVTGERIYFTRDIHIFEHLLDCSISFRQKIPQWLFELYLQKKTQKLTQRIFGYKVNKELAIERLKPLHLWQYKIE
ncbi:serine/threonine-protein kinase [Candidatus Uabimicrobium amorphum]|uniref:Protein kinase domain-containing protein n=1 Tax=Uabimicrobium amorphum TaxID=2596890 RepID=A0A5S9ISQ2_UABAM|nr:serine/threonine-protein kinase [Candidatus Uabimicrobium amorphum]BBM86722.1 hypothetical protein UABAM_05109 [Candidatus Uabimicrobium amorphum]